MTSVFASRRRAEEFSSLVEDPTPGAVRDARLEEFLAIVESLRAVPAAPEPRPEFVGSLRAELMAAADTLLVPAAPDDRLALPVRSSRRDRRVAAAIGGLAVLGAGTSMAVAAQSALPGEMLYPLKRAIEDAQVGVASGRDAQGLTLLDSAATRLSEVQALGREGRLHDDERVVATSLVDFATQADQASDIILTEFEETGDRDLVRELRDFTGESMSTLQTLESLVPESARDELLAAVELLGEIDARAQRLCPTCGGVGIDQIPPVLLSSAATETPAVVIPGATVSTRPERGRSAGRDGEDSGSGGQAPLGTDSITTAPGSGSGDSEGGAGSGPVGTLGELAGGVTGSDPTTSNGGGGGGGGDGPVKDTVDTVKEPVDKVTDKVKDGVEDTVKGVDKTLDDATDTVGGVLNGGG